MGWYQDNFPGSAAAKQRILLSRGVIIYSIVVGSAFYFLAPACRRIRKELDEGNVLPRWGWMQEKQETRGLAFQNLTSKTPTVKELLKAEQAIAKLNRGDSAGPSVSESIIRGQN